MVPGVIPPDVVYVPAMPVYYPFLQVRDVMQVRARHGLVTAPWSWTSRETLAMLELDGKTDCVIADLSRSELRSLSVAEAIVQNPAVLLIDTAPSETRVLGKPVVTALRAFAEKGGAVVIAVRDTVAVAEASTRIVMLRQGVIARTFYWDAVVPAAKPPLVLAETLH
jgi:ABC-type ATPase involved in cell division